MFNYTKILIFALSICIISLTTCTKKNNEKQTKAIENTAEIEWQDLTTGLEKAKLEKKPAIIFFYTDWCVYCKKMENEVFSDATVKQYLAKNFINIRTNPEKENKTIEIMGKNIKAMDLLSYMGGKGFPSTIFWDKNQKPITNVPGFIETKIFLPLIKYMDSECYSKNVKFENFLNGETSCSVK